MGVAVAQPFYAELDWPVLGPGDPYGETTQTYGAEVAHLFVLIDLNSSKMVSMAPDDESTIYPPAPTITPVTSN
jgi:hypothetical protein